MGIVTVYPALFVLLLGVLEMLVTLMVLKGKAGMAVGGVLLLALRLVGLVVMIVGASRLAKPSSTWASWMYDEQKWQVAWLRRQSRNPDPSHEEVPPAPAHRAGRPRPPRELTTAFWLLVASMVPAVAGAGVSGLFVGVVGPHLVLMRAGRRRSRTVAVVLSVLGAVVGLALLATAGLVAGGTAGDYVLVMAPVVLACALTGVAAWLLRGDAVERYLLAD